MKCENDFIIFHTILWTLHRNNEDPSRVKKSLTHNFFVIEFAAYRSKKKQRREFDPFTQYLIILFHFHAQ